MGALRSIGAAVGCCVWVHRGSTQREGDQERALFDAALPREAELITR
jgi:hypothetical protein